MVFFTSSSLENLQSPDVTVWALETFICLLLFLRPATISCLIGI